MSSHHDWAVEVTGSFLLMNHVCARRQPRKLPPHGMNGNENFLILSLLVRQVSPWFATGEQSWTAPAQLSRHPPCISGPAAG
jgi:hypothetical protein